MCQALAQTDRSSVSFRVGNGILERECLNVWNADSSCRSIGGFQNIEVRAFCAGVVDVQQYRRANLLLNVEVSDLHIAEPVVRVDGVVVRDVLRGLGGKTGC